MQCAVYCGIPAANAAFQIASEVLAETASANLADRKK
jgi:alkylhydroperoxidase/carboxymuconolactone decarboxylase family protein YurZ